MCIRDRMNADLNEAGTTPSDRERLNKYVRNGASSSAHFFNKLVGKMSVEHCLSGNLRMIAITSSTVTGLSSDNIQLILPCEIFGRYFTLGDQFRSFCSTTYGSCKLFFIGHVDLSGFLFYNSLPPYSSISSFTNAVSGQNLC